VVADLVFQVARVVVAQQAVQELPTKVMQVVVVLRVETHMVNQVVVALVVLVVLHKVRPNTAVMEETVFLPISQEVPFNVVVAALVLSTTLVLVAQAVVVEAEPETFLEL
jgi:hypothetical protein